jgi:lysophospholipase L1-like esterase
MVVTTCARLTACLAFLSLAACNKDAVPAAPDSDGDVPRLVDDGGTAASHTGGAVDAGRASDAGGASVSGDASAANDASGANDASTASTASTAGDASAAGDAGDASKGTSPTAYDPCPPAGTPCAIMPLGDSITEGVGSSGGGYRVPLFHLANQKGKSITFVGSQTNGPNSVDNRPFPQHHEGHQGFTIDNGGGREGISPLVVDSVKGNKPNIVMLMIGTNDVGLSLDLPNAPTRLGNLIDTILATDPSVLLVVAQIVPAKDTRGNADMNRRVREYNASIPNLVKARAGAGKHIVSVDMYGAFTADSNYTNDYMANDLHPNDAGYAVIADTWYGAVGGVLR